MGNEQVTARAGAYIKAAKDPAVAAVVDAVAGHLRIGLDDIQPHHLGGNPPTGVAAVNPAVAGQAMAVEQQPAALDPGLVEGAKGLRPFGRFEVAQLPLDADEVVHVQ